MPLSVRRAFLPHLALQLVFVGVVCAQPAQLRIMVIEGQDALNNTQLSANRDVIIEIHGADQALISGAAVTFTYPTQGPSGMFANGMRSATVTTGMDGRAIATGVRPIGGTGTLQIRVSASYLGRTATTVIPQTNVAALVAPPKPEPPVVSSTNSSPSAPVGPPVKKPGMKKSTKILIFLAVAGGAAAATIVATRSGSSSSGSLPGGSASTPIVITPGTPTVGAPR